MHLLTTGELAGAKHGDFPGVDTAHSRKNVGFGLLVVGYRLNPWPKFKTFTVTEFGAKTLQRAHRLEVQDAIARGEAVPQVAKDAYDIP